MFKHTSSDQLKDWPPPFTIRISQRAHSVRLTITRAQGLVITFPKRGRRPEINQVLDSNRAWIIAHLANLTPRSLALPKVIELSAIGERWHIHYRTEQCPLRMVIHEKRREIEFFGPHHTSHTEYTDRLKKWLRQMAKLTLIPILDQISLTHRLSYNSVCIRSQNTRWGSCSAKKKISLNYKLLCLPPTLMRHIILHELCHTVHLNHSKAFWRLLERLDPRTPTWRKEMHGAQFYIPDWIE